MAIADTLSVTPIGDREVLVRRSFNAPRSLVFDAWTKPDLLKRWNFGPDGWTLQVCTVDLRVGGKIRFEWLSPEGGAMGMTGTYQDIVVPGRLVSTEKFDQDWTGGEALSTLVFVESAGRTTVTNTIRYPSPMGRDMALQSGMDKGMAIGFDRLERVLAALAA